MTKFRRLLLAMLLLVGMLGVAPAAATTEQVREYTGTIDGAKYLVKVPDTWNGTLLLYSHGLYPNGYIPEQIELSNQPAQPRLLDQGYALAASLYRNPGGYSVPDALRDQPALLRWFAREIGEPRRVIAWGASGGGLDSVLLGERNPKRIDGVLGMCGLVGGAVPMWNQFLDYGFTIRTLLAPELKLTHLTDPAGNDAAATAAVQRALSTPSGRARLALANAFAGVPGWSHALEPRPSGVDAQIQQQGEMDIALLSALVFGGQRADVEARAGGNPNWNVGVDYRTLLARADEEPLVRKAYRQAGLNLNADLNRLNKAPRIKADPRALAWLIRNGQPSGRSSVPALTLHPVGDGIGTEQERHYGDLARRTDLRQLYVNRAGHCMHTAAEELTALRMLERRLDTGRWPASTPALLNKQAGQFGPEFHQIFDWIVGKQGSSAPAFVDYRPAGLPRPFPY